MGVDSFPSFRKPRFAIPQSNSLFDPSLDNGSEDGEIIKLYTGKNKYRADVRLVNGVVLEKVRLPGVYYGKLGFQHGHKNPYMKGQRVKVVFLENRRDLPVIDAIYALAAGDKESNYFKLITDYDPEEVSSAHESGHKTIWKDGKIIFQDKLKSVYLEIDYDLDTIKIKTKLVTLEIKTNELVAKMGSNSIELGSDKIKLQAPKIIISNGVIEFDLLTHDHISSLPGNKSGKPNPGS